MLGNTTQKNKSLDSILKNRKLTGIISDALNAPYGSTKRTQAKSILSSLKKLTENRFDGQGGPETQMPSQSQPQVQSVYSKLATSPRVSNPYGAMLNSAPVPQLNQQNEQVTIDRNATNQKVYEEAKQIAETPTTQYKGLIPMAYGLAGKVAEEATKAASLAVPAIGLGTATMAENIGRGLWRGLITGESVKTMPQSWGSKELGKVIQQTYPSKVVSDLDSKEATEVAKKDILKPGDAPRVLSSKNSYIYRNKDGSYYTGTVGDNYQDTTSLVPKITTPLAPVAPVAPVAPEKTKPSVTEPAQLSKLQTMMQEGLTTGMSSEMFARSVLNNVEALREMYPGVPDSELPLGAAYLPNQLTALESRLKEENDLNQLGKQKSDLIARSKNIVTDLTDYVRGKDQYINKVDAMIKDVENQMLTSSSASNPVFADRAQKHIDFLNVLKGNQNKRYIDLLNQDIDRLNGDSARIEDELTRNTSTFQQQLDSQTALLKEDYQAMKDGLKEMYDYAKTLPSLETEALKAEVDKMKTYNEYLKLLQGPEGENFYKDQAEVEKQILDPKTQVLLGAEYVIPNVQDALASGKSPNAVVAGMRKGILNAINSASEDEKVDKILEIKNFIDVFANSGLDTAFSNLGVPDVKNALLGSLQENGGKAVYDYTKANFAKLATAIDDYTSMKDVSSQAVIDQWVADNSAISPKLLKEIAKAINLNVLAGTSPRNVIRSSGKPISGWLSIDMTPEELATNLSSLLTAYWSRLG